MYAGWVQHLSLSGGPADVCIAITNTAIAAIAARPLDAVKEEGITLYQVRVHL